MKTISFPSNPGTLLFLSVELPKSADQSTTLGMGVCASLKENYPLKSIVSQLQDIGKVNPKMVLDAFGKDVAERIMQYEN